MNLELKNKILKYYEIEKNHMQKFMDVMESDDSNFKIYTCEIPINATLLSCINLNIDGISKECIKIIKRYELGHFGKILQNEEINAESKSLDDVITMIEDMHYEGYAIKCIYLSYNLKMKIKKQINNYRQNNNRTPISDYLTKIYPIVNLPSNMIFITCENCCKIIYPKSNRMEIMIELQIKQPNNANIQCRIKHKLKIDNDMIKKIIVTDIN